MGRQIGYFFLYIGLVITVISVAAFYEKTPSFLLCGIGAFLMVLSIWMIIKFKPEPEAADRFKTYKKISTRRTSGRKNTND